MDQSLSPFAPFTIPYAFVLGLMIAGFYGLVGSLLARVTGIMVDRAFHPILDENLKASRAHSEPETTAAMMFGVFVLSLSLALSKPAQSVEQFGLPTEMEVSIAICISMAALSAGAVFAVVKTFKVAMSWLRTRRN